MRILLSSHVSELYGAGRSLLTLASGLRERGHVPLVTVPGTGSLSDALRRNEVETAVVECPWWAVEPRTNLKARQWYLRRTLQTTGELKRVIQRFRPDVVHTNAAVIPAAALAARRAGVPHVWHLREYGREDFGLQFILGQPLSLWLMGTFSAALIAISRSVATAYTAPATARKLHVVYNGVELPPGLSTAEHRQAENVAGEPVLALAGILHPAKGQDDAIRALAILRGRGLPCRLMLIGADPVGYGPTLRTLIDELGLASCVTFTGHLPDPLPEMARADVFLMCSRSEAFGRVTVEAMLLGRPVVGANTGGTPELIEDGRTGLLYRQGDPAHLADRIAELLVDPAEAARLGAAARQVAQSRFSVAQYVNGVEDVYRQVLGSKKKMIA